MAITLNKELWDTEGTWETTKNTILKDGQEVGVAYTMKDTEDEDKIYLEDFTVYEEHRNQGIGTEVLKIIAKEAWDYVYMAPTDENNQRLYERLGEELDEAPEVDQGYGVYKIEG